jgi:hypothetical protein
MMTSEQIENLEMIAESAKQFAEAHIRPQKLECDQ